MILLSVVLAAALAGVVQSVTGFGGAVVMMLVLPHFFSIPAASSIASAVCLGLNLVLLIKFRRHLDWRLWLLPTLPYLVTSTAAIHVVGQLDLQFLSAVFGGFLVVLAGYFFLFADRVSVQPTRRTAIWCGGISGVTSGLFGIGGPLLSLYFLPASGSKERYTANLQCSFFVTNLLNMFTRLSEGIMTADLIPLILVAFLAINVGKEVGLRILGRLNEEKLRRLVYLFVGLSGLLTLLQNI